MALLIEVGAGRCAGAAVVEGESAQFLRSGVTRGRGYGRCGGARVYKGLSKIFLGQIFQVLRNIDAGACVTSSRRWDWGAVGARA